MSERKTGRTGLPSIALHGILAVAIAAQLSLLLHFPCAALPSLVAMGWGLFAFSAVPGWVSTLAFRRHGALPAGRATSIPRSL